MSNPYGRSTIVPLTNQSGGGVIAGDVVVIDTAHDDSFVTTTSANFVGTVGVAQQTIGAGAVGLVCLAGKVDLVNVNASVTRGHYGATFTVAKQATDAGASRGVGTFCEFTTGGATPKAIIWPVDLLGSSLTNPMTTEGDIIYGGAAGAPTRLAVGANRKLLKSNGTDPGYAFPTWIGCRLRNSIDQTINNTSANGAALFDTEDEDTDNFHSTSSNTSRITIPTGLDGVYLLTGTAQDATGGSFMRFYKNGAALAGALGRLPNASDAVAISGIFRLAATDYMELTFYTNSANHTIKGGNGDNGITFAATFFGV